MLHAESEGGDIGKKKPHKKTHKKHYGSPSIPKANLTILSDIFSIKYVF